MSAEIMGLLVSKCGGPRNWRGGAGGHSHRWAAVGQCDQCSQWFYIPIHKRCTSPFSLLNFMEMKNTVRVRERDGNRNPLTALTTLTVTA